MVAVKTAMPPMRATPPPEALLQYLPIYRVIVCTFCINAVQPKAIARHLKDIHCMKQQDRQPFLQHVEKLELVEQEVGMQHSLVEFPVPLLPVQSGLQCELEGCTYLCVTEKRMKHHWPSTHGRHGRAGCDWKSVPVQTFFKGNLLRYFTGTPSGKPGESIAPRIDYQSRVEDRDVCQKETISNEHR